MKKISASTIKNTLDKWVSGVGTGRYQPGNYVDDIDNNFSIPENFGIQQVKTEIYKFIDVLLKQKKNKNCLEIGLGAYGSTHFLWRLIFKTTITIEYQKYRVFKFTENMNKFHNKFVLNDLKSRFIFGLSHDTLSVEKLEKILDGDIPESLVEFNNILKSGFDGKDLIVSLIEYFSTQTCRMVILLEIIKREIF